MHKQFMNKNYLIAIFRFLFFSYLLFFTPLQNLGLVIQNESFNNNFSENILRADQILDLYPDSAVYYYQNALESLKSFDWEKSNLDDSTNFYETVLLNKIGYVFHMQSKYSMAQNYYRKALGSSKLTGNDSLVAECEFSIGEILLENGSYIEAINSYIRSIELFKKSNYKEGELWANLGIGIVYRECGNKSLSLNHYSNAKLLAEELENNILIGICDNNIGNLYRQIGDFETAIEYLHGALKNFERQGEELYVSDVLDSIGDLYSEFGEHQKALDHYERSVEMVEEIGDNYRLFSRYSNLAKTHIALDNADAGLMFLSKALKLAQSIGDKARMSEFYILIANFYKKNNDYKNSFSNLNKSLQVSREIGDTVSITSALVNLSELHFEKGDYNRSKDYGQRALKLGKEKHLLSIIRDASYYLYQIAEKQKDYERAFQYSRIYNSVKDSLLSAEKIKILEETEAKYNLERLELEKLKVENAKLTAEQQVQTQKILIGSLIFLVVVGGGIFSRYFFKKQSERNEAKEKSSKLERKIDLLNSQLNAKNRELTSKALLISNNNKNLEDAITSLDGYLISGNSDKREMRKLKSRLQSILEEESWEDFLKHFEDVHPQFYKKLTEKYPALSAGELKICAFLRMNLNTKEIAHIANQTTKSIEVARTRIRKKLSIDHKDSLTKTIQKI